MRWGGVRGTSPRLVGLGEEFGLVSKENKKLSEVASGGSARSD